MKLNFKKYGEGNPLIILHGLFGQSDNWATFGKKIGEQGFAVYLVDLRNHGRSPHSDEFNLESLARDVVELIQDENISDVVLTGHSLGGKTAMNAALANPGLISKLIVIDIGVKYYPVGHDDVLDALLAVDLDKIKSRGEAEKILSEKIRDTGTRQFLLKNLYWKNNSQLAWRMNLNAIEKNSEEAGKEITGKNKFEKPVLFIRGENSNYILDEDIPGIINLFPGAKILTAPGSGHWVHVDAFDWLFETMLQFIK